MELGPLEKKIKNEEVEEISFCHQVGAFNHTVPGVLQQTVIQQRTCLIYPSPSTSDHQDYYILVGNPEPDLHRSKVTGPSFSSPGKPVS